MWSSSPATIQAKVGKRTGKKTSKMRSLAVAMRPENDGWELFQQIIGEDFAQVWCVTSDLLCGAENFWDNRDYHADVTYIRGSWLEPHDVAEVHRSHTLYVLGRREEAAAGEYNSLISYDIHARFMVVAAEELADLRAKIATIKKEGNARLRAIAVDNLPRF